VRDALGDRFDLECVDGAEAAIAALERAIALQTRPDLVQRLQALKTQAAAERAASDKPKP